MSWLIPEISTDQVDDWFNAGKRLAKAAGGKRAPAVQTKTYARCKSGGRSLDPVTQKPSAPLREEEFVPPYKSHSRTFGESQTEYARKYQEEEERNLIDPGGATTASEGACGFDDTASVVSGTSYGTRMEDLETASYFSGSVATIETFRPENYMEVYQNYDFKSSHGDELPIAKYRENIVETIESNMVTVIQGSTGSGKTTQVPQYILDHYAKEQQYCNIIVTQPRRIAAMSISRRVCFERNWDLGGCVGYQVGMDKVASEDTRILYVTTGVLLMKLVNDKNMLQYTHVILDEVHERDQENDFSLLVVRKLLRSNSRHVKIVLMSATFDSDMFAQYYSIPIRGKLESAPVISVEGRVFDVKEFYIEDLKVLGELPELDELQPSLSGETLEITRKLILQFDRMELQEEGRGESDSLPKKRGTVLIFLPGMAEIDAVRDTLKALASPKQFVLLPLHSTCTLEEQIRVFEPPAKGYRKIIMSTNLAESSITVPDIKYVIDMCLTKNLVSDNDTNYTSLQLEWASKANCTQRKGRAGRVSNGRVYRMVTREFYRDSIMEYSIPEMQRCPMEQVVLQAKLLNMGEPKALLALALSPPNLDDLERAVLVLKEVAALTTLKSGKINPHDGDLTFIGRVLASLPVDIRIGKMIILGHIFGLLEECLIIGAGLSIKSIFRTPYGEKFKAYKKKLTWSMGSFSDCIAMLNAYKLWDQEKKFGQFKRPGASEIQWCKQNLLELKRLREVTELVREISQRLAKFNIQRPMQNRRDRRPEIEVENSLILKLLMAGAFYPNFFLCSKPEEEDAVKAMSGFDPKTVVMVKGLPAKESALYKSSLEMMFIGRDACTIKPIQIHFEGSRAFIEFQPDEDDMTKVTKAVYLALKLKQTKSLHLDPIDPQIVQKQMEQLDIARDNQAKQLSRLRSNRIKLLGDREQAQSQQAKQVELPGPLQSTVPVVISHIEDAGHFWAFYTDHHSVVSSLDLTIAEHLQSSPVDPIKNPAVGQLCLAEFQGTFYRARVESVTMDTIKVFFVDYGNKETINRAQLHQKIRQIPPSLLKEEFQAMECFLSGVRPSNTRGMDGQWSREAKDLIERQTKNPCLIKIYSIVSGKIRAELIIQYRRNATVNLNDELCRKGLAEPVEEGYASRQNHQSRDYDVNPGLGGSQHTDDSWLELAVADAGKAMGSSKRGHKITVQGPNSAYEVSFNGITKVSRLRSVKIERDSINCITIDDEPQDSHDRLMVAAHVGLNPSGNSIIARNTTIMPHIHGLPAILALLFAPCAEIRTDSARTKYIGVLCGLGVDPDSGHPAFPDHEMEITFDVTIDNDDLTMVNGVRTAINMALGSTGTVSPVDWTPEQIKRIQINTREKLITLIEKRRESITPQYFPRMYRWNQVPPDEINYHQVDEDLADFETLLQLHNGVLLKAPDEQREYVDPRKERMRLIDHVKWLRQKVGRSVIQEDLRCELCQVPCNNPRELMIHVHTNLHTMNESALLK
ncbi:ATP-dependent RNA helicase TDRD9-like [Lineus longissimus]|uniref:ATP-dependent RNA helicase TDRD9-like n=1 Tax=Lineus longissimus TaxID=88925 RepID=UPI002B4C590B